MPQNRHDYLAMFPSPRESLVAMRHHAAPFMHCPNGHPLPHRKSWGRCSPADCVDYGEQGTRSIGKDNEAERRHLQNTIPYKDQMDGLPIGLEKMALRPDSIDAAQAEFIQSKAREAMAIMQANGQNAAREAVHPLPELPQAPAREGKSAKEYVQQRLEDISPWLLEQKIASLRFAGTQKSRDEILADLLDRAGHGRKPDTNITVNAPVTFVTGFKNPYEAQKTEVKEIHNGQQNRYDADRDAAAAERGRKLLRESGFGGEEGVVDSPGGGVEPASGSGSADGAPDSALDH